MTLPDTEFAVLVVDDDDAVRRLVALALRNAGMDVVEARDGPAALQAITEANVAVVIMDVGMPGMTGTEVVRELRQRPETATLPVILMTGSGDDNSVVAGLESGADDFLVKPVRLDELVARVRAHTRTQSAWSERVDTELKARMAVVAALEELNLSPDAATAAATVVAELARRTGTQFVAVLQVTEGRNLQELASYNPTAGVAQSAGPMPADVSDLLLSRVRAGPWVAAVDAVQPGDPHNSYTAAGIDLIANAPVFAGDDLVGILAIGARLERAESASTSVRARLLAQTIDYAAVVGQIAGASISDRAHATALRGRLNEILARADFFPVYQPVVELESRRIVGFEALTRFADGTRPDVRFAEASGAGLGERFEIAALEAAVAGAATLPAESFLSLNLSPRVLMDAAERVRDILGAADRPIVIELTEHAPIDDYVALRATIAGLGPVMVAVDDAGAGYASLRHILEVRPTYAKLDISLVRGIEADKLLQALVAGLEYFALKSRCQLIAEGIETAEEELTLRRLGVQLGQGYLLGRPQPVGHAADVS